MASGGGGGGGGRGGEGEGVVEEAEVVVVDMRRSGVLPSVICAAGPAGEARKAWRTASSICFCLRNSATSLREVPWEAMENTLRVAPFMSTMKTRPFAAPFTDTGFLPGHSVE